MVIQLAGAGHSKVSLSSPSYQLEKTERSEEKDDRAANPEQVRIDTVCVASSVDARTCVLTNTWEGGNDLPIPKEKTTTLDVSGPE